MTCRVPLLAGVTVFVSTFAAPSIAQEPLSQDSALDVSPIRVLDTPIYTLELIPPPTDFYFWDSWNHINDLGQIAGVGGAFDGDDYLGQVLFRYTDDVGIEYITQPGEYDWLHKPIINNAGQIGFSGEVYGEAMYACRYTDGVGVVRLTDAIETPSSVRDMNEKGHIAGQTRRGAFLYTDEGGLMDIAIPGAIGSGSEGINNDDVIVGFFLREAIQIRSFSYSQKDGLIEYGNFGYNEAGFLEINDRGEILGLCIGDEYDQVFYFDSRNNKFRPFADAARIIPQEINNRGVVACNDRRYYFGFLWTPQSKRVDLNELLPAELGLSLRSAEGINENNQIVGVTSIAGRYWLYRLTLKTIPNRINPVPPEGRTSDPDPESYP